MKLGREGAKDFLDVVYGDVMPVTRGRLLDEWRSDAKGVIEQAKEVDMPLDGFLNAKAPATRESPGSAVDVVLFNQGIRTVDTYNVSSTKTNGIPTMFTEVGEPKHPVAKLLNAHWDECYNRTLLTGQKAATSLAPIEINSVWRQIADEMPYRMPLIAPAFNFMKLLAFGRRIREDQYRLNKWTNASKEQMMQEIAEGTAPRLFELGRDSKIWEMIDYRAGIEATDSFLNDPQVRVSDITNAIEEIAIGHRIVLLQKLCKTIVGMRKSSNVFNAKTDVVNPFMGVTYAQGRIDWPRYTLFKTKSGTAYHFDCAIGNELSIVAMLCMSMTDGTNLTFGSWAMSDKSTIEYFNEMTGKFGLGWVDKDAETGFSDNHLYFFQRMSTVGYVQRSGMDQDEMQRVPDERKMRRWLGTSSLFCEIDDNSVWEYDMSAST